MNPAMSILIVVKRAGGRRSTPCRAHPAAASTTGAPGRYSSFVARHGGIGDIRHGPGGGAGVFRTSTGLMLH